MPTDLFGEQRISIRGNNVLSEACNRLLAMYQRSPELFEGNEVGEINRRLYGEILWEDGAQNLIPADKKQEFIELVIKTQEADVFSRALRSLVYDLNLIKLSAEAVRRAEQMRNRLKNFK